MSAEDARSPNSGETREVAQRMFDNIGDFMQEPVVVQQGSQFRALCRTCPWVGESHGGNSGAFNDWIEHWAGIHAIAVESSAHVARLEGVPPRTHSPGPSRLSKEEPA